MKNFLAVLFLSLGMVSCDTIANNPNVEEEVADNDISTIKAEVMAVHDTAMAKMNTLSRLQKLLKEEWQTSIDSMPYRQAYRQLRQAKDDMMDWMREFEIPEEAPEEEVREYLLRERKVIHAIDVQMNEAINEAQHLLETTTDYPPSENKEEADGPDMENHQH